METESALKSYEERFPPRALTRAQRKKLIKTGIILGKLGQTEEAIDAAMDAVFEMVYGENAAAVDDLPNGVTMHLWQKIVENTFSIPGGKKNSSPPGGERPTPPDAPPTP